MADTGTVLPGDAPEEQSSILDPFREEGILGGAAQIAPHLIPGFSQGAAAGSFSIPDLVGALPSLARETVERTPGIGDAIGVAQGLTGDMATFDRTLQFAGVIGAPFAGVRAYNKVRGRTLGIRRAESFPANRVTTLGTYQSNAAARLSGIPDYDALWPTVSPRSRQLLAIDRNPRIGYDQIAATIEAGPATSGFLSGLGQRLAGEVQDYRASITNFSSIDEAAVGAVAMEVSKFEHAAHAGLLKGSEAERLQSLWTRLKADDTMSVEELTELSDGMVKFADATQAFGHPEFGLEVPTVGMSSLEFTPDGVNVGLRVVDWERVGFSRLTEEEAGRRINQMTRLNPTAMTTLAAENIVRYWDGPVTENIGQLRRFRGWYPNAAKEAAEMAVKEGLDRDEVIGAASILSAGELWETNIQKAVDVVRHIRKAKTKRTPKQVAAFAKRRKLKVSEDDARRVLEMLEADDILGYFRRDPAETGSLKQPAFTQAIIESTAEDEAQMARALFQLMKGAIDDPEGTVLGAGARDQLPVVVDRHAFAIGLGFSITPNSDLGGGGPMFDAFAQAYRIAAGQIGEVDGKPLLPTELQALTWMQWREDKGVTRGYKPSAEVAAETGKGFQSPSNWTTGQGPTFTFSTSVLDHLTQGPPMELGYRGVAATTRRGLMDLDMLGRNASPKEWRHTRSVSLVAQPDGTFAVEAPEGVDPDMLRTTYGSVVFGPSGQRQRPRRPQWVDDVRHHKDRLGLRSETYTAVHPNPALEDGRSIVITAQTPDAHRRMVGMLRERGVQFDFEEPPPHQGLRRGKRYTDQDGIETDVETFDEIADPEFSREEFDALPDVEIEGPVHSLILRFQDADQLKRAASIMDEPSPVGDAGVIPEAAAGMTDYLHRYGQRFGLAETARQVRRDLLADPEVGENLALMYEAAADTPDDPLVLASYKALVEQTEAQYEFMTEGLGITVEVVPFSPYDNYAQLIRDVRTNRRLQVQKTGAHPSDAGHPLMTNEQNDKFRAVHDFFGHGSLGNSFDRHGEEIAWARHSQMFSDDAVAAMTSETRAQNSFLNWHPDNVARKARGEQAQFAQQRVATFPSEFNRPPDEFFSEPVRVLDDVYGFRGAERVYYVSGAHEAPEMSGAVFEHHFQDAAGQRSVARTRQADENSPGVVKAYVPRHPDLKERFERIPLEAQQSGGWQKVGDAFRFHGEIDVVGDVDVSNAKGLFNGVKVDGAAPERIRLFVPEAGVATASFNDAPNPGPPTRTVEFRRPGKAKGWTGRLEVVLPQTPGGLIDGHLVDDVVALLDSVGHRGKLEWVTE